LINSREDFVPLDKEILTLEYYLSLQKLRFDKTFDYQINVDETIETSNILVPPMLAQPFIENSIEHGFRGKEDKGVILISYKLIDNKIAFEIEDNGSGRQKSMEFNMENKQDHTSLSTKITTDRLTLLDKTFRQKVELQIIDLKDDNYKPSGTKVIFHIPIMEK